MSGRCLRRMRRCRPGRRADRAPLEWRAVLLTTPRGRISLRVAAFLLATLLAAAVPAPAQAGEIFGGVYVHDVKLPTDLSGIEDGADIMLGYRGGRIARIWKGELQPYAFAALNTAGQTNYGSVGISARFPL